MTESLALRVEEIKQLAARLETGEVSWESCRGYSVDEELSSFINLTTAGEFTYE